MLALDLGVFNRRAHSVGFREALGWSGMWVALAAAFGCIVYFWHGHAASLEFATGYLIELSLSVDNLFVFLMIFRYFRVPDPLQHRVLIRQFHWITYIFGALLVWSGIKLLQQGDEEIDPEKNPMLRLFRRWMPVTEDYVGDKFWVRQPGLYATPLVVVLLVVETTDILFAVDSIPAVLAITLNAFIVYTSNVFAIMGLRSMYFALAGMMDLFHYLHYGLSVVLIFIGLKMLGSHYVNIPTGWALSIVLLVLGASILASLLNPQKKLVE